MGAFLDKPRTSKNNSEGAGLGLRYGTSSMQGWRVDMEDAHFMAVGLAVDGPLKDWAFFSVFDGHAGAKLVSPSQVSLYSSEHLLSSVLATDEMRQLICELRTRDNNGRFLNESAVKLVEKGVKVGFLSLDAFMKNHPEIYGEKVNSNDRERSGSTVVCALITPSHIFLINLGDSRAVLSKMDLQPFGTEDHKPYLPKERDRIINAGGSVMIQRVNGSLAVSRALGDYEYKSVPGLSPTQQLVSPEPDVYCLARDQLADEFLLLACDGVFDVMANDELCSFVTNRMHVTDDLPLISNCILDTCLSKGSRDNMTIILIAFDGCPKIDPIAQKVDVDWKHSVDDKTREIALELLREQSCTNDKSFDHVDVDAVMKHLTRENIPGMPPGTGIHAVRSHVEAILNQQRGNENISGFN